MSQQKNVLFILSWGNWEVESCRLLPSQADSCSRLGENLWEGSITRSVMLLAVNRTQERGQTTSDPEGTVMSGVSHKIYSFTRALGVVFVRHPGLPRYPVGQKWWWCLDHFARFRISTINEKRKCLNINKYEKNAESLCKCVLLNNPVW